MDDRLKELMQDLGNAINESLSESVPIAEAIGEIKRAGYDVFLVLEVTIGFNKREKEDDEPPPPVFDSKRRIKLTTQDNEFLREIKIRMDDK